MKEEVLKYVAIAPFDEEGYMLLGNIYVQAKSYDLALEAFDRVKSINPQNANAYLSYITTLELAGENAKAIEALKEFKELFPGVTGVDEQIKRIEDGKTTVAPAPTVESTVTPTKKTTKN